ncbi:MAG TPA: hypothetical protein VI893_02755, partial [Thermoplasmata archaeon]|nr:hypothetical protein [Thermoplasmata archaeon]
MADLLLGALAGVVGTLAMSMLEYPTYRARGLRAVPVYEMNLMLARRIAGPTLGGKLPVAVLTHFGDGMFLGAVFMLAWSWLGAPSLILAGLAYGVMLGIGSNLLHRTLTGRLLIRSREGRAGILLTMITHPLYGVVVGTVVW